MDYKNYFKKRLFENMMVNPENMPSPSAEYGAVLAQPTYQNPVSTEEQPPLPPFQLPSAPVMPQYPSGHPIPNSNPPTFTPPTSEEMDAYREALRNYNRNYPNWLDNFVRWLKQNPGHSFEHESIPSSFPIPQPPKQPRNIHDAWRRANAAWNEWIRRYYEMP